ncbi:hypothetical protein EC988_006396, partial [Linderina pennispora]
SPEGDSDSDDEEAEGDIQSDAPSGAIGSRANKKSMSIDDEAAESEAAKKAEAEAAAESSQQAVEVIITQIETVTEINASAMWSDSDFERNAATDAFSDDFSDVGNLGESDGAVASDDAEANATHTAALIESASPTVDLNSDAEGMDLVTQLVHEASDAKSDVNEAPSIVVLASIDEEYEEEFFSDASVRTPSSQRSAESDATEFDVPHVMRNSAEKIRGIDKDAAPEKDESGVRGIEPIPDVSAIKENQNRAMNI